MVLFFKAGNKRLVRDFVFSGERRRVLRLNWELLDSTLMMESEWSSCGGFPSDCDFSFAFNDPKFSDRVLRIEIMSDTFDVTTIADSERPCKRRRENGGEAENSNDSNRTIDCSADTAVKVKTLHISSPILAAKSHFFYKLFSNGMSESEQRHVALKINESEEAALMELLNFMYTNTLNMTATPATLLDVLIAADKFGVSSCITYCSQLLLNLPMAPDSALLYLELPHTLLMADAIQPLIDAAKKFLVGRYKDITKFKEEVIALPLSGIEAIFASDDLQVSSEDVVYVFVLNWTRQHYNREEERREVMGSRLAHLIRFPFMTSKMLKEVLTCIEFKHEEASKLVLEALFLKAEAAEESTSFNHHGFVERAYKYRPIKVVRFELPQPRCVVYLNLKREECATLFPSGWVRSQTFNFGGERFFLAAECIMDQHDSFHWCRLILKLRKNNRPVSYDMDYEFAARCRTTEEFVSKFKGNYTFNAEGRAFGTNFFKIPWSSFMAEDSLFFTNGVLHLRAELTIKH